MKKVILLTLIISGIGAGIYVYSIKALDSSESTAPESVVPPMPPAPTPTEPVSSESTPTEPEENQPTVTPSHMDQIDKEPMTPLPSDQSMESTAPEAGTKQSEQQIPGHNPDINENNPDTAIEENNRASALDELGAEDEENTEEVDMEMPDYI